MENEKQMDQPDRVAVLKNRAQQSLNGIRDYARANPGRVLGGLSALVIAAGLMGRRRT
jgi:hypothetical protein